MRRVVTGHGTDGKSMIISDRETTRILKLDYFPDVALLDEIWATEGIPSIPVDTDDPTVEMESLVPPPGGTRFRLFTVLPDEELARLAERSKDTVADVEKIRSMTPGIFESMEVENPGMHTTNSIDYGIVLEGEMHLEVDDGQEVLLKKHDTFIQNGTRHAWRNRGKEPCVGAVVMIGAIRNR